MTFSTKTTIKAGLLALAAVAFSSCSPSTNGKLPDELVETSADAENEIPSISVDDSSDTTTPAKPAPKSYSHIDPTGKVPKNLLTKALNFYKQNQSAIKNKSVLSIIDFSKPSNKQRFFIIDMITGKVAAIRVAHGRGSDPDHDGVADRFSNAPNSHASSLGFYRTGETYPGGHGLSLRLDGLSSSNSNARPRAVVIHGADYVQDKDVIQGRSYGCPAVSWAMRDRVIKAIKGGSILFAGKSL